MKKKVWVPLLGAMIILLGLAAMNARQECKVFAAENTFEMTPGGSIRIVEPYGLRFQVKMSVDVKEKADKVGMLIFPADYLVDGGVEGDVYYESVEALAETQVTKHRMDLDLTSKVYEKDGYWYGNGAIVNIKGDNMSREFVGIAYYELDGEKVFADTSKIKATTRCAAQVALVSRADKNIVYSKKAMDLLSIYIDYLKGSGVEEDSHQRYKVRGFAADNGLHISATQYVDNVITTGEIWTEQTHLEAEIWQHNIGNGWGGTYCLFGLDGTTWFNNGNYIRNVVNNVTIIDRGTEYKEGFRYEIRYDIFIAFDNNLENPSDGPYAYVQMKHHMPGETRKGFGTAFQEYRDNNRFLWQDDCSSYEFRKAGFVSKVKERTLANVNYEGEHLVCTDFQGRQVRNQELDVFSNGAHKLLLGDKAGDYMSLIINVPKDGYYNISAKMTRADDFGYVQHYIDGVKMGNPINNIEGYLTIQPGVIGNTYLTAGQHELKVVMVASDSGKVPGYLYGLDVLTLKEYIPSTSTTEKTYEGELLEVISAPENTIPTNQNLFWIDSSTWGQDSHLLVKFSVDNQSVSLAFEVAEDGMYSISAAIARAIDFGKVQFAIDGTDMGTVVNGYDVNLSNSGMFTLGNKELTKGTHTLTITNKGTSGNGRLFALDLFKISQEVVGKQDWEDDGILKILNIGNSFSVDSQEYVYQIAKDLGVKDIKLGNLFIGGCSLETHLNNANNNWASYTYYTNSDGNWQATDNYPLLNALTSEKWDYVVFQQVSGLSGVAESYDNLDELIHIVEMYAPQAKYVWQMTWAYQHDSTHGDFVRYNNDQMTMYNAIVSAVQSKIVNHAKIDYIIPSGTAVQNARTSYIGDTLTRDGFHLSYDFGRYLAGVTVAHTLLGKEVDGLTYRPSGVSTEMVDIVLESVKNAIENPYEVTESEYKEFDYSNYKQVDVGFTSSAFYNSSLGEDMDVSSADPFHNQFLATKMFTKEELPVGTIIEIAEGYQYRPERWPYDGNRPNNISTKQVVVDELWWNNYTKRAFNISSITGVSLSNFTDAEKAAIFKIYVPKATYDTISGK